LGSPIQEAYDRGNGELSCVQHQKGRFSLLGSFLECQRTHHGNEYWDDDRGLVPALLECDNPEDCIKKETEEGQDIKLERVTKVFESFMSLLVPVNRNPYIFLLVLTKKKNEGERWWWWRKRETENIDVAGVDIWIRLWP